MMNTIDCLAFAAHPDDAELFCGGTMIKTKKQGSSIAICDLTRGELSTNGDAQTRNNEAKKASMYLNLDERINLEIPDGNIELNLENRAKVIDIIRKMRPRLVLVPYWSDRHPDHVAAAQLIKKAIFDSGLAKIETEFPAYRPSNILHYMLHELFIPTIVIDITEEFKQKMEAIRAYQSQFMQDKNTDRSTFINNARFLESIEARAKLYGFQNGCTYAEPFYHEGAIKLDNIFQIYS
jgi:bacillithiol biosynthesis deacetylase BshB1